MQPAQALQHFHLKPAPPLKCEGSEQPVAIVKKYEKNSH